MTTKLKTLIEEAQELSPSEQLELIHVISLTLSHNYEERSSKKEDFWKPKTLEEIILSQQVSPVTNIDELAGDFWPEDESVDDFIDYIYQQRREDCLKD